jgi:hypothetical protein
LLALRSKSPREESPMHAHARRATTRSLAFLLALCAACSDDASPDVGERSVVQAAPPKSAPGEVAPPAEPAQVAPREVRPMAPRPEAKPVPRPPAVEPMREPPPAEFRWDGVLDEQQIVQSSASVVTLLPEPDAVNVGRESNVEITFSVAMQLESIEGAFEARTAAGPIAGVLSWDAGTNRATFDPTEPLPAGTPVTVELAETLSTSGAACEPVTWSFTTGR